MQTDVCANTHLTHLTMPIHLAQGGITDHRCGAAQPPATAVPRCCARGLPPRCLLRPRQSCMHSTQARTVRRKAGPSPTGKRCARGLPVPLLLRLSVPLL